MGSGKERQWAHFGERMNFPHLAVRSWKKEGWFQEQIADWHLVEISQYRVTLLLYGRLSSLQHLRTNAETNFFLLIGKKKTHREQTLTICLRVWMLSYKTLAYPFFLPPWGEVMHTSSRTEKYVGQWISSTYRSCNQQHRIRPQSLRIWGYLLVNLGFSGFVVFWSYFFSLKWNTFLADDLKEEKKKRKDHG